MYDKELAKEVIVLQTLREDIPLLLNTLQTIKNDL